MFEIVIYGSALVKKRIYWSTEIYGDEINAYFERRKIGEHGYLSENWKGIYLDVFFVKDQN